MIDKLNLSKLTKSFQIDEYTILREYLQVAFLDKFYQNRSLTNTYFKGGTALRLIFRSPRFSEDLDFTTSEVKNQISKVVGDSVYSLQKEFMGLTFNEIETIQGFSYRLKYPSEFFKQQVSIKMDFSQRESVMQPVTSPIETDLPVVPISLVKHISDKEILAEKIRAIFTREKGRDIYDLWFLLSKNTPIDKKLINSKFDYYKDRNYNKKRLEGIIENLDGEKLDQDLRKFLPISQREIIKELKRLIIQKLQQF